MIYTERYDYSFISANHWGSAPVCVYIGIKGDGVEILLCFFSAKFLL